MVLPLLIDIVRVLCYNILDKITKETFQCYFSTSATETPYTTPTS